MPRPNHDQGKRSIAKFILAVYLSVLTVGFAEIAQAANCCLCAQANDKVCLTDPQTNDCSGLAKKIPNSYTCSPLNDTQCKAIVSGGSGVCPTAPQDVASFKAPLTVGAVDTIVEFLPVVPQQNVKIPGLTYGMELGAKQEGFIQKVQLPFLGQFISALYKYMMGATMVAAAVMIIYGGFLYILGQSMASVSRGKSVIFDAIIGLVLMLSAYMLLNIVNPQTTALKPLGLERVKPDPFNDYMGANEEAPQTMRDIGIQPRAGQAANVAAGAAVTGDPSQIPDPRSADTIKNGQLGAGGPEGAVGQAVETPDEYVPPPSTARYPTDLTIPKDCPGRDPAFNSAAKTVLGKISIKRPQGDLTIASGAQRLNAEVIKAYLEEQSLTGVPAGVLMAQMMTEAPNPKCVVLNLFGNMKTCGSQPGIQYFNFGGMACPRTAIPADSCVNPAFFPGWLGDGKKVALNGCNDPNAGPNIYKNNKGDGGPTCMSICQSSNRNSWRNCGNNCYPEPSTNSGPAKLEDGTAVNVTWPSVQCSIKYNDAHSFLRSHLKTVRYCLPYNDSVYKFAYCIGASTYASAVDKGPLLAAIIERNCLCGSKDSTKCKRDLELEARLMQTSYDRKVRAMQYQYPCIEWNADRTKCLKRNTSAKDTPDYEGYIKAIEKSTGGMLRMSRDWDEQAQKQDGQ